MVVHSPGTPQPNRFVTEDGTHTNHAEAMNAVLKRKLRRSFWQVKNKGANSSDKIQLIIFEQNCVMGKDEVDPIVKWFNSYKAWLHCAE